LSDLIFSFTKLLAERVFCSEEGSPIGTGRLYQTTHRTGRLAYPEHYVAAQCERAILRAQIGRDQFSGDF
jgi:hypothetical protein